jgi:hypothetical protein
MRKDKEFEETCELAVNNQKPTRNLRFEKCTSERCALTESLILST